MKRIVLCLSLGAGLVTVGGDASGRGFGGAGPRGGSFSGSAGRTAGGGYGSGFSSFSGTNAAGGSYSGSRSTNSWSSAASRGAYGSYDHTWTGASGASVNTSGSRSATEGRYGGVTASGNRDTTVTTASGQTYSGSREGAVASGPGGRTVGGASGSWNGPNSSGTASGGFAGNRYTGNFAGGTSGSYENRYGGSGSWESAFSGNRYTGNMNHYASVYGANGVHSTAYWSTGYMGVRAGYVRTGFGYYNCFNPAWYTAHPGCWAAAGWAAGAAWAAPSYSSVATYAGMPSDPPPDYDYGSTVVYQGDQVYVNGQPGGTAQQFADQATAIAGQGQTASPPPTDDWKPLGVFALVQGDDKTSNYIFQLAVNKDGIIRGNYYDGVQDTTTEVFGSIDKATRLAAWTVGKKKDRVFEAGLYNLTKPECPCLLHLGGQQTTQMMLVRVEQPKGDGPPAGQ